MPMEVEELEAKDDSGKASGSVRGSPSWLPKAFKVPNSSKYSGGASEEKKENVKLKHTHYRDTKQEEFLKFTSLSKSKLSKFSSPKPCSRMDVVEHTNLVSNYNLFNPSLWARAKPNPEEPETMEWTNTHARLGERLKIESVEMVTKSDIYTGS